MTTTVFSIIVTTRNRARLLTRALDSIRAQTVRSYAVIVIDDGSTDRTHDAVREYLLDPRFTYHRNDVQKGVTASRNIGYDLASSELITALDDDDELAPHALEVAYKHYARLGVGGRHFMMFDTFGRCAKAIDNVAPRTEGYLRYSDILSESVSGNFWLVFSRDLIETPKRRHDERLFGGEGQLYLKIWKNNWPYHVPQVLYYVDDGDHERLTTAAVTKERLRREIRNAEIHLAVFGDDLRTYCPQVLGKKLGRLGYLHAVNGRLYRSTVCHMRALRYALTVSSAGLFLRSVMAWAKRLARDLGGRVLAHRCGVCSVV